MVNSEQEAQPVSLMERLRQRDWTAFDELVDAYWEPVLRFFWKRLPPDDAEDLGQNVFIAVYRAVLKGGGPVGGDGESWRRYLFTCARNLMRDYLRRMKARAPFDRLENLLGDEGAGPDVETRVRKGEEASGLLVSKEESEAIRDCMGRLDVLSRAICWLHFVDSRSKREIARALEMPESSLRATLVKALKVLRRCLEAKGMSPVEQS